MKKLEWVGYSILWCTLKYIQVYDWGYLRNSPWKTGTKSSKINNKKVKKKKRVRKASGSFSGFWYQIFGACIHQENIIFISPFVSGKEVFNFSIFTLIGFSKTRWQTYRTNNRDGGVTEFLTVLSPWQAVFITDRSCRVKCSYSLRNLCHIYEVNVRIAASTLLLMQTLHKPSIVCRQHIYGPFSWNPLSFLVLASRFIFGYKNTDVISKKGKATKNNKLLYVGLQ